MGQGGQLFKALIQVQPSFGYKQQVMRDQNKIIRDPSTYSRSCLGCCVLLTVALVGLHIAVGIFGIRWGEHRRDFQPILQQYQYVTVPATLAANGSQLTPPELSPLQNDSLSYIDRYHPLDPYELYYKEMKTEAIYLFASSAAIIILGLIIFFFFCFNWCNCGPRMMHRLATFLLLVLFAIGVVLILRYKNNSNLEEAKLFYSNYKGPNNPNRNSFSNMHSQSWRTEFESFNTYYKLVFADFIASFAMSLFWFFTIWRASVNDIAQIEVLSPVVVEVPPMSNRQF